MGIPQWAEPLNRSGGPPWFCDRAFGDRAAGSYPSATWGLTSKSRASGGRHWASGGPRAGAARILLVRTSVLPLPALLPPPGRLPPIVGGRPRTPTALEDA